MKSEKAKINPLTKLARFFFILIAAFVMAGTAGGVSTVKAADEDVVATADVATTAEPEEDNSGFIFLFLTIVVIICIIVVVVVASATVSSVAAKVQEMEE